MRCFGHRRFLRLRWLGLVLVVISVLLLAATEVSQGTLAWICLKWCHALKQRLEDWTLQIKSLILMIPRVLGSMIEGNDGTALQY